MNLNSHGFGSFSLLWIRAFGAGKSNAGHSTAPPSPPVPPVSPPVPPVSPPVPPPPLALMPPLAPVTPPVADQPLTPPVPPVLCAISVLDVHVEVA